ncbi:galectin-9 [Arapaima gigas]
MKQKSWGFHGIFPLGTVREQSESRGKMAFYNQQPFFNPPIPFKGSIQGRLQEGKVITVAGQVLNKASRFHVNLQCGSMQGADVALHFNPRFDSLPGYVVANTYQNSKWGTEERKYEAPFPLGSSFTLTITVNRDAFTVVTNGKKFMDFKHRMSFYPVDTIAVDGGVKVTCISFQNPMASQWTCVTKCPLPQQSVPWVTMFVSCVQAIPYRSVVGGGMYPGRSVTIHGMVNPNANRFVFNLSYSSGIALHFNPRFDENTVVRNSHMNNQWGPEERQGGLPFQRGQPFAVTILCDPQAFQVLLNGALKFTYNHRFYPLHDINMLEINGDVTLNSVIV